MITILLWLRETRPWPLTKLIAMLKSKLIRKIRSSKDLNGNPNSSKRNLREKRDSKRSEQMKNLLDWSERNSLSSTN